MRLKLFRLILSLTLIFGLLPNTFKTIQASTLNCDVSVHAFSVDTLSYSNPTVNYTSQGCYLSSEYGNALAKFNELVNSGTQNVVIRYISSSDSEFQSPLKIIRADRAMAYTQNFTYTVGDITTVDGVTYASTIGIYNDAALSSRYTYLDNKEPLFYYTTDLKNSGGSAVPSNMVAYVEVNGAKGYIKLTGIDIIPYIYVENHVLVPFYIKLSSSSQKQLYTRLDGRSGIYPAPVTYIVTSGEMSLDIDRATTLDKITTYAKAPSWLSDGTYYSPDGIRFYTDRTFSTPVLNGDTQGYYYNYYSYLSLRTKTTVTSDQFNTYLYNVLSDTYKDGGANDSVMLNQAASFITAQESYGMNALLLYSMALQESGKGTSDIALSKLNIFSVNAVDSNTGLAYTFSSIEDAVSRQMGIYLRYYMDINSTNFYGSNIGNKGAGFNTKYASDPFWSTKIARYAYQIDKANGLADFNKYSLAILKPEISSSLYSTRNLTTTLYTIPNRALNYPITLTASYNNTYYSQSTSPIQNGALVTNATTGLITYDWNTSKAYLNQNQINLLNNSSNSLTVITDTDDIIIYNSKLEWTSENTIYLKGFSALKNTNMNNTTVTHTLKAISMIDSNISYSYPLTIATPEFSINLLNGLIYDKAWFEGTVDLVTLPAGNYFFQIITTAGDTTGTTALVNSDATAPKPEPKNLTLSNYRFIFNNGEKMRYELYIEPGLDLISSSYVYPSRFYPVSFFNSFEIENQQLVIDGLAYIIGNPTGANNTVSHKLVLLSNGTKTSYPLTTSTGLYDYSNGGFDYTYAWFNGSIDLTTLSSGKYTMYIETTSNGLTDVIEIRNYTNAAVYTTTQNSLTYTIEGNQLLKRRMELTIQ